MNEPLILTKGHDPELFIVDAKGDPVNAINVVQGHDKHNPIDLGDGIKCYHDNALIEFSHPPCHTTEGLICIIRTALLRIKDTLGHGFSLMPRASYQFPVELLDSDKAWEAGCDPTFCAYSALENDRPRFTDGTRTGSFHLHIGNAEWNKRVGLTKLLTDESKLQAIRLLDVFVGVGSILFDRDPSAQARRALYGKAGEFRKTDYGVEYRVLGPYAMSAPSTVRLVWELADHAMGYIKEDKELDLLNKLDEKAIIDAINSNNPTMATAILRAADTPTRLMAMMGERVNLTFEQAWGL